MRKPDSARFDVLNKSKIFIGRTYQSWTNLTQNKKLLSAVLTLLVSFLQKTDGVGTD